MGVNAFDAQGKELPPRARRIHLYFDQTCVRKRNYLRVRGEYANEAQNCAASPELPPRARRILLLGPLGYGA